MSAFHHNRVMFLYPNSDSNRDAITALISKTRNVCIPSLGHFCWRANQGRTDTKTLEESYAYHYIIAPCIVQYKGIEPSSHRWKRHIISHYTNTANRAKKEIQTLVDLLVSRLQGECNRSLCDLGELITILLTIYISFI